MTTKQRSDGGGGEDPTTNFAPQATISSITTRSMAKQQVQAMPETSGQAKSKSKSTKTSITETASLSARSRQTNLTASKSSISSAKRKLAVIEARLNAQREIDELKRKHAQDRLDFEEELIKHKHAQAAANAFAEKQEFEMQRLREEKELLYQQQLSQARLEAELREAIAELSVHQLPSNEESNQQEINANISAPNAIDHNAPSNVIAQNALNVNDMSTNANVVCSNVNTLGAPVRAIDFTNTHATERITSNTQNFAPSVVKCVAQTRPTDVQCNYGVSFVNPRAVFSNDVPLTSQAESNQSPFLPFRGAGAINPANSQTNTSSRVAFETPGLKQVTEGVGSGTVIVGQQLPSFEIKPPVFDGNSEAYYNFTDAFDSLIDNQISDPKLKLFYLLQFTKGVARTLIQGCQYMPPDVGYATAKCLLRDHFGQKLQVATACINSVTNGPVLNKKNISDILEFSAKLTACQYTLSGMNYLHKMDNIDIIRKLTKRFPPQWMSSWEHNVDQILHVQKREISISDVSTFVTTKTRECTNFVTQPVNYCCETNANPNASAKRVAKSFGMQTKTTSVAVNKRCHLCGGPHYLNQCQKFRNQTYDERRAFVEKETLCFCCLNKGHWSNKCDRKNPCRHDGCKEKHTTLLRPPSKDLSKSNDALDENNQQRNLGHNQKDNGDQALKCKTGLVRSKAPSSGMLPVIPVKVRLKGTKTLVETKAFFDNGSTNSFITAELLNKIGVHTCPEINVNTATLNCKTQDYKRVKLVRDLVLFDYSETNSVLLAPLLSTDSLPISASDTVSQEDLKNFPEFSDIVVPHVECEVGLLIGNDNLRASQPLKIITALGGSYAVKTVAGWITYCANWRKSTLSKSFFSKLSAPDLCTLCYDIKDSTVNPKKELSVEHSRFLKSVCASIRHLSNLHYEIDLPVRYENLHMPQNKDLVVQRAMHLKRRFKRETKFKQDYQDFMRNLFEKGYAEEVADIQVPEGKVWYLPHHGVYHPDKPNKLRVVFDASAKFQGVSLNEVLLPGPDLTSNLISVLFRFRREQVALQGDIQSMFHQISVPVKDRDLFRFVWWKGGNTDDALIDYRMTVYPFGTVCSPPCANFALRHAADAHISEFSDSTVNAVHNCFYVDDFLTSVSSVKEAQILVRELCKLLKLGGFTINRWISNDREVMSSIPKTEWSKNAKDLNLSLDELPLERALGLYWDVQTDNLRFKINENRKPATRRGILSTINSVYDPLGFGIPFLLPMKLLLQRLCKLKLDWDEGIPNAERLKWTLWLSELPSLSAFKVPRCYKAADLKPATRRI